MFDLPALLPEIVDTRQRPQIPTKVITQTALIMFLCRLGSLNSMEQLKESAQLRRFLGNTAPSADSVGRIFDLIDPFSIRKVIRQIYDRLKRNKVLKTPRHGLIALIVDGHESHATYRRHCDGCLERTKMHGDEARIQYYHRNVTAQLVFEGFKFLLDAETQLPGEGELACGMRLLDRILKEYPRAFHVAVMDALYAKDPIFEKLVQHNKHFIVVLKRNRPAVFRSASMVVAEQPSKSIELLGRTIEYWDFPSFLSCVPFVRCIATRESQIGIRRQLDGNYEVPPPSSWYWLTSLSAEHATARDLIDIAHSRWCIENEGFNELANHWHANHVYKHAANAILNFWLMSMLAYNLFRAFFRRNLNKAARAGKTMLYFARQVASELHFNPASTGVPP